MVPPQNDIFRIIYFKAPRGRFHLDADGANPHGFGVSRPDGRSRMGRKALGRGKSGLHRHTVPDNFRRGQPQGQCHRKRTARRSSEGKRSGARVKRCGKSAPRVRQRIRHGKPHREQDRIGTATRRSSRKRKRRKSDVRLVVRVGCSRQRGNVVPEEWPSRIVRIQRAVPYRTRLTGWLMSVE